MIPVTIPAIAPAAVAAINASSGFFPEESMTVVTAALDPKTAELIMELTGKVVKEKKLTTIMVTHNLRYAVEYGNRILMMHQGHAVLDKAGEEKAKLVVDDLLDQFNQISIECGN